MRYLVYQVGCIECGVSSYPIKTTDDIDQAKTVADASMSELHRQLEYKSQWYGREFIKVSHWQKTSGVCTGCGEVSDIGSSEEWQCGCGKEHNRDKASAEIIYRVGIAGESAITGVERELVGGCNVAA